LILRSVPVSNGLLTDALDFNPDQAQWDGSPRWLEIAVIGGAAGGPTTLSPRIEITRMPYAVHADDASVADSVSPGGVDGVALAAIQGSNLKVEQRDVEIAELRQRLEKLEQFLINKSNASGHSKQNPE